MTTNKSRRGQKTKNERNSLTPPLLRADLGSLSLAVVTQNVMDFDFGRQAVAALRSASSRLSDELGLAMASVSVASDGGVLRMLGAENPQRNRL
ncbi:unnamed protein product [Heligmosomoides polygyrus]|uniref:Roadblock/LC7 domain-containing protein n=1 Tax=Heligmosomoides polygyrus TaxID=6339 RepID=A0A183FII8_HELPZ|nr:unnamed protein product [Heligmosomoides polygyrus]